MQFDTAEKQKADGAFNELDQQARQQMRFSSVRLNKGNFFGSGVLVNDISKKKSGILTAKHNLRFTVNEEEQEDWNDDEVKKKWGPAFLDGMIIGFGGDQLQPTEYEKLSPDTSTIEFRDGDFSWEYDLMFISADANKTLLAYVRKYGIAYGGGLAELAMYKKMQEGVKEMVFVTGFGDVKNHKGQITDHSHPFQLRVASGAAYLPAVARLPDADNVNVLTTLATDKTSTAGGDSGGPMFWVSPKKQVLLLGTTLGANYKEKWENDPESIENNASTYVFREGKLF